MGGLSCDWAPIGRSRPGRCGLFLLILLAEAIVAVSPAIGQGSSVLDPPVSASDLDRTLSLLELSGEQRAAAKGRYENFLTEFHAKAASLRTLEERKRRAIERHDDDAVEANEAYLGAWSDFIVTRRRAERALLDGLKSNLTPNQLDNLWPGAERQLRRRGLRNVRGYTVSWWFRLDLGEATEQAALQPDEVALVHSTMGEWELEIDVPLAQRADMWDQEMQWPVRQQRDREAALNERDFGIGNRVAGINRKYARVLLGKLPPQTAERLERLVHERVYPLVFTPSRRASAFLRTVEGWEDLDASQRSSLEAIGSKYLRESASCDNAAMSACDRAGAEMAEFGRLPEQFRNELARQRADPQSRLGVKIAEARNALEDRTIEAARAVLTVDQRSRAEKVPK